MRSVGRRAWVASIVVFTAVMSGPVVGAQGKRAFTYDGIVINQASRKPIANATIEAIDLKRPWIVLAAPAHRKVGETQSDANGRFSLTTVGRADKIWASTEQQPYIGEAKIGRWARRQDLVIELIPRIGISTYEGGEEAPPVGMGDIWQLGVRVRLVLLKILADRDRSESDLRSLQAYYDSGIITAKDLALFQDYRKALTQPCDTRGEARVEWGRREFRYVAIDQTISFEQVEGCGDCITSR